MIGPARRGLSKDVRAGADYLRVTLPRLRLDVLMPRPDPGHLSSGRVTYQAWQFLHLANLADVCWDAVRLGSHAVIAWDELALLGDSPVRDVELGDQTLFVFVCHDWWCRPLELVEQLRRRRRVLMVLRHEAARRFFDDVAPELPKVVHRPGVEPSVFHPHDGVKTVDIVLSGSETPDYPVRARLNRLVRDHACDRGWKVLDLTGHGLGSCAPGTQAEYAPALAAAKVSPTGTNRGGTGGATLVTQYFDLSAARAQMTHPVYGLGSPDLAIRRYDTAGVTPRYLESLASKTLLLGDLPAGESEDWYRDKMVTVSMEQSDGELLDEIDRWVADDDGRTELVEHAYRETLRTETSEGTARGLLEAIHAHL